MNKFKFPESLQNYVMHLNRQRVVVVRSEYTNGTLALFVCSEKYGGDTYCDITTNLNDISISKTEGYVNACTLMIDRLKFIKKNKLGKIYPYFDSQSGFNNYKLVQFDLSKTLTWNEYNNILDNSEVTL